MESLEIKCVACGEDTIVRREAVYDGFKKTGEKFICMSCGHQYLSEDTVPFKQVRGPSIFTENEKPSIPDIFAGKDLSNCRRCRHYVVNPFVQRCSLHEKEVQATDVCDDFQAPEDVEKRS